MHDSRWDRFWFSPESPRNFAAARITLSATALWMVLSRWNLPTVVGFPAEIWETVSLARRARFGLVLPEVIERGLWIVLIVALLMTIAGAYARAAAFASGLLLVHFAPLETIFWTGNPYLRGFTLPALGLLILSFGPDMKKGGYRWPLALIQVLICQVYVFAEYAKVVTSGLSWFTADNIRAYLLLHDQFMGFSGSRTIGHALADSPEACAAIVWLGLIFELAFPLVLFSRRARWILLPLALLFHIANALLFHIFFQNVFLLLLFIDYDP